MTLSDWLIFVSYIFISLLSDWLIFISFIIAPLSDWLIFVPFIISPLSDWSIFRLLHSDWLLSMPGRPRTGSGVATLDDMLAEKRKEEKDADKKLHPQVAIMTPILRFLQLLCENHNR